MELVVKFEPFKVSTNHGPPALAEVGDIDVREGALGFVVVEDVTVNGSTDEMPTYGVFTWTIAVPAHGISDSEILACN